MAEKRLIYFTADQVTSYRWKGGNLSIDEKFSPGEEGVAAFAEYISRNTLCLYYILADIVEEDFAQESIPAVRGKDRKLLLERKIAQRYRDTSLALTLSLGVHAGGDRREEQILFSSFTNTQLFQPWLTALRSREARLVGLYSVPLVAPLLGTRLEYKNESYLLVTVEEAGLRQTFVHKGAVRFSRLGRAPGNDPAAAAEACAAESARIQQYLVSLRILSRDSPALKVIVMAPGKDKSHYDRVCVSNPQLTYEVLDLEVAGKRCGLKSAPQDAMAEALLLHILASSQAGQQFAAEDLRRQYHLWRARIAMMTVGAAAFVFCLMLAGLKMIDIYGVNQQIAADREQQNVAQQQYASIQATFPKTPTTTERLAAIVKNYATLQSQSRSVEPMLVLISQALTNSPQIEIEAIDWDSSKAPSSNNPGRDSPASAAPQPAPAGSGSAPAQDKTDAAMEYAVISGRITSIQSSDYRAVTQAVDDFVENLRRKPGVQLIRKTLPFDISAGQNLTGDIGAERAVEVPRFTVVIGKQAGAS